MSGDHNEIPVEPWIILFEQIRESAQKLKLRYQGPTSGTPISGTILV